jgi:hypothetical protein
LNFYYLPSRRCVILWSQKCACTSISRWIKASFKEVKICEKGESTRTYLAKNGYNFPLKNLTPWIRSNEGELQHAIISSRDPISRITSSFVNKFHVYENRTIFDNKKKIQGFSKHFSKELLGLKNKQSGEKRRQGDFSLQELIEYLYYMRDELKKINPHFTPQINTAKDFSVIKSLIKSDINVHPLRIGHFSDDLRDINTKLELKMMPSSVNSTSLPSNEWRFDSSADSASKTVSILHQQKLIPNSAALRELLQQKPHLQQQFWELFQYDFALQDAMNHLSKN